MTGVNTTNKTINKQPCKGRPWKAALYVRISREDGDKEESDSIVNQKALLQQFVELESDIQVYDIYVDDGWTGTNFHRPSFMRMMKDIGKKLVDCVIVKDLSRFGRNHIEAGQYIEEKFVLMDVRFIAIADNVDSVKLPQSVNSIFLPIKNLLNEEYCRDASTKVRNALDTKRKMGKHIGSFACYGYKKDPNDHNHLVIDEDAAEVVRDIFKWYISGMSILSITQKLNELKIPNPSNYKKQNGLRYRNRYEEISDGKWPDSSVRRILGNQMYVGDLIQGVQKIKSYKVRVAQRQAPEDWIVVKNTHEPIVNREDFELVQALLKRNTRKPPAREEVYLFSGFVRCGDCGRSMYRKQHHHDYGDYSYFVCTTYSKVDKTACTKHTTRVDRLEDIVLASIQSQIALAVDMEKAIKVINANEKANKEAVWLKKRLEKAEDAAKKATERKLCLYDDFKDGLITKEEYIDMKERYEGQRLSALEEVQKTQEKLEEAKSGQDSSNPFLENFVKYKNIDRLTREIVVALIDTIFVYEGNKIKIVFNYQNPFEAAMQYIKTNRNLLDVSQATTLFGA